MTRLKRAVALGGVAALAARIRMANSNHDLASRSGIGRTVLQSFPAVVAVAIVGFAIVKLQLGESYFLYLYGWPFFTVGFPPRTPFEFPWTGVEYINLCASGIALAATAIVATSVISWARRSRQLRLSTLFRLTACVGIVIACVRIDQLDEERREIGFSLGIQQPSTDFDLTVSRGDSYIEPAWVIRLPILVAIGCTVHTAMGLAGWACSRALRAIGATPESPSTPTDR